MKLTIIFKEEIEEHMKFWALKKAWAEETAIEAWNRRAGNG